MKRLIYKRMSKKGTLTIPAEVRREIGCQPGDAMEIEVTDDNRVLIGPYILRCQVCGGDQDVISLYGHGICKACARRAYEKTGGEL